MKTYLQIIINHVGEQTPTIILHVGSQKYIFNCSENFMRFQKFNKIKLVQGICFFLTRLSSETLDGLIPNMTLLFCNAMGLQDKIYGPQKLVNMFQDMKSKFYIKCLPYSFLGFETNKLENNKQMSNFLLGINDMASIFGLKYDDQFSNNFFQDKQKANAYLYEKFKQQSLNKNNFLNDARQMINEQGNYQDAEIEVVPIYVQSKSEDVLAYLIKFQKQECKMNKEKLKSFNIPGKMMKEFQQNKQIELDGKIIKLQEVLEDPQPAQQLLIFDCLSEECVKNIINCEDISYTTTQDSFVYAVIHMTPIHILKSHHYELFLKKFDVNTLHIFVNSHIKETQIPQNNHSDTFLHVQATNIIAEQFPENFPKISENTKNYKSESEFYEIELNQLFPYLKNKTISKKNYQLIFNSKQAGQAYQPILSQKNTKKYFLTEEFQSEAEKLKVDLVQEMKSNEFILFDAQIRQNTKNYDPHIYFLGTSCMTPTIFRNNSSILIYEQSLKQGIMLDCGEGTYYQLLNQFGEAECQEVLRNLKLIVLTHAHSDHYLGFQSIVYQRHKAFQTAFNEGKKFFTEEDQLMYIALPWSLAPWYGVVDCYMEKMNCKLIYFQDYNGQNLNDLFNQYNKKPCCDNQVQETELKEQKQFPNEMISKEEEIIKENQESFNEDQNIQDENYNSDEEREDNRRFNAKIRIMQLSNYLKSDQTEIHQLKQDFNQFLLVSLGIQEIKFIPVIHCPQAFGIVFQHTSGIKISYSGDTRPCIEFAQAAEDSDLMIHEGTFNQNMQEHAKYAKHSTAFEAIDIAIQAKAKALVLTHLSKRHSKLDLGDFSDQSIEKNRFIKYRVSQALDHLAFQLSKYSTVPFISKCVHSLFPNQDDEY
ncbi:metallo-beta-lactamase domain protein (macronuclear) [Tetrahymena thermophila SB210]|uniref:ribonuclease Z n=1 Tax=Tetrahymena thermophila (strain SB210) TaxID=312017 RepID=I7M840_TETTS|nr:metallo-beta-lactamase domain protein [Tetrahymena thermophila SB210]EAR97113.2 metallo-beta-lactamase domain protein [Tetrahymena thermophila SB210]|eukprot:XP_001017358.2 metallo-beta-lactamase domain protein [Tetrahymena thermophila SB210]